MSNPFFYHTDDESDPLINDETLRTTTAPISQHCRPEALVHRPTGLGTTMGHLSIISGINLLVCAIFCVYSNITGLDATQQHEEHTTQSSPGYESSKEMSKGAGLRLVQFPLFPGFSSKALPGCTHPCRDPSIPQRNTQIFQ